MLHGCHLSLGCIRKSSKLGQWLVFDSYSCADTANLPNVRATRASYHGTRTGQPPGSITTTINKASRCHYGNTGCSTVLDFGEVPVPKSLPVIGTTLSLIAAGGPKKLHKYIDQRHKQLGPIFKDHVGPVTAVFVSDAGEIRRIFSREGKYPEHIKPEAWLQYNKKYGCTRGLFFMDGEEWLHHRRKMNKLLLKGDLTWIEDCCEASNDLLLQKVAEMSGEEFNHLDLHLYKWSIDTVISILVGAKAYKRFNKKIDSSAETLSRNVKLVFETTCKLQLLPVSLARKYNISSWKRFEKSVHNALNTARMTMEQLDTCFEHHDGLLSRMRDEGIEEENIKTIVVDLMLGAGDTTSNTMIWMLYLLGRSPEVQTRLRKNLRDAMLRNTTKETLRLYPSAPFLTRVLPEEIEVCGYHIPAQTLMVMSIYTSGRDSRYFKEPLQFLPERWDRDSKLGIPSQQHASIPFGIGARSCIGKKIAEAQLHGALGRILRDYEVNLCDGREIEDTLEMITKPDRPVRLVFEKLH